MIDSFHDPENKQLILITQHYARKLYILLINVFILVGSYDAQLNRWKKRGESYPEDLIIRGLAQMLTGIQFMHEKELVHSNITPNSIFIDEDGFLKICDLSKVESQGIKNEVSGLRECVNFMAPEYFKEERLVPGSDIWSIGCIMHTAMSGSITFPGEDVEEVQENVVSQSYSPLPETYSEALRDLVFSMLQEDPNDRPSAEELL